jgi:uncharacterized protein YhhL (DUF1145 family)
MAPKVVVGILWVYCALSFFAPLPLAGIGRLVFWVLLITHAVECAVFLPRMRAAGGSLAHHIAQVMLWGVFHGRTLPAASSS